MKIYTLELQFQTSETSRQ